MKERTIHRLDTDVLIIGGRLRRHVGRQTGQGRK